MLDETDKKLLAALQNDAHLTTHQLGEVLHMSPSQIGRRRQKLEADGIIRQYTARLDPRKLGLEVQGFVQVHADYLLRVYCEDLPALNRLIHEVLLPHKAVARVHSQIVMDQLKRDGPLPT